jgi:Ran GTPase-activating protein (RanGAP) involved in mRNA processing and transport
MLRELNVCGWSLSGDPDGLALLCAALRASRLLTFGLSESCARHWADPHDAGALLRALTGHATLRKLEMSGYEVGRQFAAPLQAAAGAALAALLAADAPALREVDVSNNGLGDAGLAPIMAVLRSCKHLCSLRCDYNGVSEAFARDVLLPAVRDNASLRALTACGGRDGGSTPFLCQAEALVAARAAADAAAAAAAAAASEAAH